MNCERFRAQMGLYLDGGLQGDDLADFERHRDECLLCRERLDGESEFTGLLTSALAPPELSMDLADSVMDRINQNQTELALVMTTALTPPHLSDTFADRVMARVGEIASKYKKGPLGLWRKLGLSFAVASAAGLLIIASLFVNQPVFVTESPGTDLGQLPVEPVPVTYAGMLEDGEVCVVSTDLGKSEWKREKDTKLPADSWIVNPSGAGKPARVKFIGGATVDLEAGSAIKPAMNPDGPGLLIEQISGRAYFENTADAFDLVVLTPGEGSGARRVVASRDSGLKVTVDFEHNDLTGDADELLRAALEQRGRARSNVMALRGMLRIDGDGACMECRIEPGQLMRLDPNGSECLEISFVGSAVGLTEGGVTTMVFQSQDGLVKVQKLGVPTTTPGQFPRHGAVIDEELFANYERFAQAHPELAERVPKLDVSQNGFGFRWEMEGGNMPEGTNIFIDEMFREMRDPDSAVGQSIGGMFEGKSWEEILESLTPEERKELEERLERMQKLWETIHRGGRNRENREDEPPEESEW